MLVYQRVTQRVSINELVQAKMYSWNLHISWENHWKSIESNYIPPWIVWLILHPLNKNSTFYRVWDGLGIKYLPVYGKDFGPSLTYRLPMYFSQFVLCRAVGLDKSCHVFHSETRPLWDSHMFYPSHHSHHSHHSSDITTWRFCQQKCGKNIQYVDVIRYNLI